ncbi:hypothetical protein CHLRE_16g677541v5 [Chlamydomonas reinhardtii]|uniref:Uncharacterized protein n=1 Tax=Chlamydomonas reinhardtii TaxID=3055 RepID=A0A2K3CVW1_CHLRE|nr:uncharacterized protein CHLRE_16g677541v5 [Chlamydomonas reinhardtii]PNW72417.1 hypothetical protein CHLRE_16g677541v5 [Chlamydomonas reinhardtii]
MGKKVYGAKGKNGGKHAAEAKSPGCGYVVQPAPQLLRAMVNPRALRTSKVPRCVPTGGALGERACGAWSSNTVNGESLPPVQRPAPAAVKAQQAVLAKMRAQLWRRAHPSAVHQHNLSVIKQPRAGTAARSPHQVVEPHAFLCSVCLTAGTASTCACS